MFDLRTLDDLVFGKKPVKKYTPRRIVRSGRFWNTVDDKTLRHWFTVRGFSVEECARRSGFSVMCVRVQLERLGISVRLCEAWTGKDDKVLRLLWLQHPNGSRCARTMGKNARTVNARVKVLGLKKPSK